MFKKSGTLTFIAIICVVFTAHATSLVVPPRMQAVLLSKTLAFERNILKKDKVHILVLDAEEVASVLKQMIGKANLVIPISSVDTKITDGKNYDVAYVNSLEDLDKVIPMAEARGTIIASGNRDVVNKGAALGFLLEAERPKIVLNITTSSKYSLMWKPAMFKVARTIR